MKDFKDYLDVALEFHSHKCPAMPMGLRAGLAAMKALGVERSQDKELFLKSETGKGRVAGCFLDGRPPLDAPAGNWPVFLRSPNLSKKLSISPLHWRE